MEENNRKGPGIFYAVVGVATLVVAIIGATFAYFSASANATGDTITGGTNSDLANALSVKVSKVTFSDVAETISWNLVPAGFANQPASLADTDVSAAVKAKCVNSGYTGCHIWKIEAGTKQVLANANIYLTLNVDATKKDNWAYAVFTATDLKLDGSDSTGVTIVDAVANGTKGSNDDYTYNYSTTAAGKGTLSSGEVSMDIHNNANLSAATFDGDDMTTASKVYYLMVYLANTDTPQNTSGDSSETGTYSGSVSMAAAGGKVSATFTSAS